MNFRATLTAFGALALAASPWVAAPARANITYTINQSSTTPEVSGEPSPLSDTITGSITTDGTIGFLQTNNIVSYNLQLTDNLNSSYSIDLTPSNSTILEDTGNGLSASATGLSFAFGTPGALFGIQANSPGAYSGYHYFCFQASGGPCANGETIVPDYYSVDGVLASGLTTTIPLNPVTGGVPEPATWALLLLGFAGIGFAGYRQGRVAKLA